MIWIKTEKSIAIVTECYLDTIGDACQSLGYDVKKVEDIKDIKYKKGDYVVVSNATSGIKAIIRGYKIIYWAQGLWPEESFMRNKSRLRYLIAGILEKKSLKKAAYCLFVSGEMKSFYEKKYHIDFKDNYYIMPCHNDIFRRDSFAAPHKYDNNVFCYIGSTAVWQCFEETLSIYSKIEKERSDSKLILLVKDKEYAKECIKKYNIKNYVIDYVPIERLHEYLDEAKYGFVIRKDNDINRVATPTKIETYICYGVMPIYSDCLLGIKELLSDSNYTIPYGWDVKDIVATMDKHIEAKEVLQDFASIYEKAYNRQKHVARLAEELSSKL